MVLNGAVIGADCLVGAGALVTEGKRFEAGSLIVGSPAVVKRAMNAAQIAGLAEMRAGMCSERSAYRESWCAFNEMAIRQWTLRGVLLLASIGGLAFFGASLLVSYVQPLLIEKAAREIVRIEVERRVGEKIDVLSNSRVVDLAQKALGKTDEEIFAARRAVANDVPRKVAEVVADMLKADCECRKRLVERAVKSHDEQLSSLGQIRQKLVGLIESSYATVTTA